MVIAKLSRETCQGIVCGVLSYFGVGFLQNFHPHLWQFIFLTVLLNLLCGLVFGLLVESREPSQPGSRWEDQLAPVLGMGFGISFLALTVLLLSRYPTLFPLELFLLKPDFLPAFLGLIVLSRAGTVLLLRNQRAAGWRTSRIAAWTRHHLAGLVLSCAIALSTFALATVFAQPDTLRSDNYFETDPSDWLNRLAADFDQLTVMRPVHPLAFIIFRPLAWLVSLPLNGDRFHASFLLNSSFGGVCVFLTWLFFKRRTGSTPYALLMAALLGLSTSHLILSVFLETYIFSAAVLISLLLLLQRKETTRLPLLAAGLLSFGITMTNFVQAVSLIFAATPRIRTLIKYALTVMLLALPLAFVQELIYPTSEPYYLPASYSQERNYQFDIFEAEPRDRIGRVNVLARSMLAFSVVAPQPLILLEETGCTFPCIQTFYYTRRDGYIVSSYTRAGRLLAIVWVSIVLSALGLFLQKFRSSPRSQALSAALLLNLLFNFSLHMNYGDDFMLYSPDWTYALVFFAGIAFENFSKNRWAQIAFLLFLAGLMINNLQLFRAILDAILSFA